MLAGLPSYIRNHHLALIALFVALGGTAYATATIGANDIKHNAVRSNHIKNGEVMKDDLAEGAVSIHKLNLPRIDFSGPSTDASDFQPHHTVLHQDGLELQVSCFVSGATSLKLFASSSNASATMRGRYNASPPNFGASGATTPDVALSTTPVQVIFTGTNSGELLLEGQLTYRDPDRVIQIIFDGVVDAAHSRCTLDGTAIPATGPVG
jgi:hypothetical protein